VTMEHSLSRAEGVPLRWGDPSLPVRRLEAFLLRPLPVWKRAMDIVGSALALLLLSPLMLAVALAVKLTSRGPVIFRQQRAGLGGRPFTFYKFRSMYDGAERLREGLLDRNEQTGPVFKMTDDPRVTPVGHFLRRWSLDELPQFWNVLKGDMSLVGPRPLPCDESLASEAWQKRRLTVTPGVTCYWQVSGRAHIFYDDWVRLDIKYLERRSFLTDVGILLRTPLAVLSRDGAH